MHLVSGTDELSSDPRSRLLEAGAKISRRKCNKVLLFIQSQLVFIRVFHSRRFFSQIFSGLNCDILTNRKFNFKMLCALPYFTMPREEKESCVLVFEGNNECLSDCGENCAAVEIC